MSATDPIITRIVIRRNQSLSWKGLGMFLAGGLSLNLAFLFLAGLAAGWWPVVGFEASVFMLLAAVLTALAANRSREVVTVRSRTVTVEFGRRRAEACIEMDRYWTRVESRSVPRPALVLRSRGMAVEIARALGSEAQSELAARLRELVGPGAFTPVDPPAGLPAGGRI